MTKAKHVTDLEDAIRQYVAAESEGGIAIDWVMFSSVASPENFDATAYIWAISEGLPYHTALGLLSHACDVVPVTYGAVAVDDADYYHEDDYE